MLSQDEAVGDYIKTQTTTIFSYTDRERLVSVIQELHKKKEYKQETLHLASNIADKYIKIVLSSNGNRQMPNLYALAAIAMLMAAKIE